MPATESARRARARRALNRARSRSICGHYTGCMHWIFLLALIVGFPVKSQEAPAWFAQSLLYLPDDVADAAKDGKRVMLYFGQPGCPYCTQLMEVNFRQRPISERMQRDFVSLELSIFGDR